MRQQRKVIFVLTFLAVTGLVVVVGSQVDDSVVEATTTVAVRRAATPIQRARTTKTKKTAARAFARRPSPKAKVLEPAEFAKQNRPLLMATLRRNSEYRDQNLDGAMQCADEYRVRRGTASPVVRGAVAMVITSLGGVANVPSFELVEGGDPELARCFYLAYGWTAQQYEAPSAKDGTYRLMWRYRFFESEE